MKRNETALLLDCTCAGPLSNVTVDGNGGHSPSCPLNPRNLPHNLTHCAGCDLPFDAPTLDEGCDLYGEYVCEGCFV